MSVMVVVLQGHINIMIMIFLIKTIIDQVCIKCMNIMYEHIERRLNERGLTASKPYSKHMSDGLLGTSAFLEIEKHKSKLIDVVNIK
ncbi:hypothetical protein WDV76_15585 [Xenorhabdus griffiniae]|uniref:hypothetical protein n=1 Tax=Xenorhabdus griffiniae TaxID=351672 RepID=UPI0030D50F54